MKNRVGDAPAVVSSSSAHPATRTLFQLLYRMETVCIITNTVGVRIGMAPVPVSESVAYGIAALRRPHTAHATETRGRGWRL
jgi:hypothetical protein